MDFTLKGKLSAERIQNLKFYCSEKIVLNLLVLKLCFSKAFVSSRGLCEILVPNLGHLSLVVRKPVSGVSDQLEISYLGSRGIVLSV